jgi:hypothetical protein
MIYDPAARARDLRERIFASMTDEEQAEYATESKGAERPEPGFPSGTASQAMIGAPRSEADRQAAVQSFAEGDAYIGGHEWAKAEQSYQRAVLYDGSVAEYLAALGSLMMLLHRWTDAVASYSAAVLLDVDNSEYRRRLKEARSRR